MSFATLALVLLTALANATESEQAMLDATQELVLETRNLVYATIFAGIAVASVAAFIGIHQILLQTRQTNIQIRQLQTQLELEQRKRLQEATAEIDSDDMADYRRWIYTSYCRLKKRGDQIIFDENAELRKSADMVEISYDKVAAEVMSGSHDMEDFLQKYQVSFLKVWIASEQDITSKVANNPNAYRNFRNLIEVIKQKNPKMPEIDCKVKIRMGLGVPADD